MKIAFSQICKQILVHWMAFAIGCQLADSVISERNTGGASRGLRGLQGRAYPHRTTQQTNENWVVIYHDSFETGEWADSNWGRGPGTESLDQEHSTDGSWSVNLRDGLSTFDSSISTSFGTDGYEAYNITFDFLSKYKNKYQDGEGLVLESSTDGSVWVEQDSWRKNGTGYENVWHLGQSFSHTFSGLISPTTHLRFRLDGSDQQEMLWIDNVTISGLRCGVEGCLWTYSPTTNPTASPNTQSPMSNPTNSPTSSPTQPPTPSPSMTCPEIKFSQSCVGCDSSPGNVKCHDRPHEMSFLFLGGNCDSSFNHQETFFSCVDNEFDPSIIENGEAAHILVMDGNERDIYFDDVVNQGNSFGISAGRLPAALKVTISSNDKQTVLQTFSFHSSCSQDLYLQDIFGALQVVGYENSIQAESCFKNVSFDYEVSAPALPPGQSIQAQHAILMSNFTGRSEYEILKSDFDISASPTFLESTSHQANFCITGSYEVTVSVLPELDACADVSSTYVLTPSSLPVDETLSV